MPTENCHDKLFNSSLADRRDAAMELRAVLPPALASQIDFETLKPMPGSFVDEAMHGSQTDLLYSVECAGKQALLYVLMEHKSDADKWTPLQMLRVTAARSRVLAGRHRMTQIGARGTHQSRAKPVAIPWSAAAP